MKLQTAGVIIFLILVTLMAGCTGQQQEQAAVPEPTEVVTAVPTPEVTEVIPPEEPAPVSDPSLLGTWYLKMISEQNGTAQVQTLNPEIMITFDESLAVTGNSGCNSYSGTYALTEAVLPDGNGMTISPLVTTKMSCPGKDETETTYLEILQAVTSYLVNADQELTLTDNLNNALVFQRFPYGETAVPEGS